MRSAVFWAPFNRFCWYRRVTTAHAYQSQDAETDVTICWRFWGGTLFNYYVVHFRITTDRYQSRISHFQTSEHVFTCSSGKLYPESIWTSQNGLFQCLIFWTASDTLSYLLNSIKTDCVLIVLFLPLFAQSYLYSLFFFSQCIFPLCFIVELNFSFLLSFLIIGLILFGLIVV